MSSHKFTSAFFGAATLIIALSSGSTSRAGEVVQTVHAAPDYSWQGFYMGLHIGYGWGDGSTDVIPLPSAAQFINLAPTTLKPQPEGVFGGGQVGYNWQASRYFVFGVETDIAGSGISGSTSISPIIQNNGTPFAAGSFIRAEQKIDWFGTVRGRLGFTPTPRLLIYGTGGLAYGSVGNSATTSFLPVGTTQYFSSHNTVKAGWAAGGGMEYAFNKRWSMKAEYLYLDLGNQTSTVNAFPLLPPFQVRYKTEATTSTVKIGLNYHF